MNTPETGSLRVLYIETYGTGSHGRVLDLLTTHSRHHIDEIRLDRAHWRWLAIGAHHTIADQICDSRASYPPDVILVSGPLDVSALIALLPASYRDIPRIAYFHESQWTYPSADRDPRPYLVQHLNTLRVCDESWFNSRYHLDTFWSAATSLHMDYRIRSLARRLRLRVEQRCRIVYPPVSIDVLPAHRGLATQHPRIVWNARWEHDKRPDRFIEFLDRLAGRGQMPEILILGTGGKPADDIRSDLGNLGARTEIPGHLTSRADYERFLSPSDILVSTADHEFFGIAVLESALAGSIPVLPNGLAYPETLPSAYFYHPGDMNDLARITSDLLVRGRSSFPAYRIDATRFAPEETVRRFDDRVRETVRVHRS